MANAQKVAEAMNAVLVREDASEEEKTHAIREAKRRWNQSGRVAAWGCLWLHVSFLHLATSRCAKHTFCCFLA